MLLLLLVLQLQALLLRVQLLREAHQHAHMTEARSGGPRERHARIVQGAAQGAVQPRRLQPLVGAIAAARRLLQGGHQGAQALLQAGAPLARPMLRGLAHRLHQLGAQFGRLQRGALAVRELGQLIDGRIVGRELRLQHDDVPVDGDAHGGRALDGVQHLDVHVRYVGVEQRELVLERTGRLRRVRPMATAGAGGRAAGNGGHVRRQMVRRRNRVGRFDRFDGDVVVQIGIWEARSERIERWVVCDE